LPKESAELLLAEINAHSKWVSPANSTDERVVLDTQSNSSGRGVVAQSPAKAAPAETVSTARDTAGIEASCACQQSQYQTGGDMRHGASDSLRYPHV
jgi:hypothetical protein